MLNEDQQRKKSQQKSWLWSDCKLVLRRTNPKNPSQQSYESLQAQVQLESEQIPQPFIPILTFQKPLMHDHKVTDYSWRRSFPLPKLKVKFQDSYFQLLKEDEDILMLYCELTVAYPCRKETHFYLEQIQSLGQKRKLFSDAGEVCFDDILIKESSNQKNNNKFSLIIKVCASSANENKIILKTLISSAFYVITNKIKRANKKDKNSYTMRLISPKKFEKPMQELNVDNNLHQQNILQLLQDCAKNCKKLSNLHPLYVLYQYSQLFRICYNSDEVEGLYHLLEATQISENSQQTQKEESNVLYELKKTKLIKKDHSEHSKGRKYKQKIILKIKQSSFKQQKKLLMITFTDQLINEINQIVQAQQQQNHLTPDSVTFSMQLQQHIHNLNKIFLSWKHLHLSINFFHTKIQEDETQWKQIQKQNVFEAYQKLYHSIRTRLHRMKSSSSEIIDQEKLHNEQQRDS